MFKLIMSLAIAAQLAGCANQPATQTAAAGSANSASMTTATTPSAATTPPTAATPAAATTAAAAATPAKATPPPGFKARKRNGELVYCTKVQPTGSLFPQDACYTPEQLETLRAQQKKAADRLLNKPVGCRVAGCVTGQ